MGERSLFRNAFDENVLVVLPRSDIACDYLIKDNADHIPLVMNSSRYDEKRKQDPISYTLRKAHPCCVVVFWTSYVDTVILAVSGIIPSSVKFKGHNGLLNFGAPFITTTQQDLVASIICLWQSDASERTKVQTQAFVQSCLDLKDPAVLRAINLEKYAHCQKLEADTNALIADLLTPHGTYSATPAATCNADAFFRLLEEKALLNLGFQYKVGNEGPKGTYTFNRCNEYSGKIIICRPLPRNKAPDTFIVIPNSLAPHSVTQAFLKTTSPLHKLIVPQTEFAQLIVDIFKARQNNLKRIKYPSGHDVDISDIRFFSEDELNTPTSAKCKKEHENTKFRERKFPDLEYVYPSFQETFDVRINGVKSQDKCGEEKNDYHAVKIVKNAGNTEGSKRNKGPYEAGDFEILYVNLPGGEGIFAIPAWEMDEHNYFKSATESGNQWISCFKPGYVPHPRFKSRTDLWTQKYYVSYDDPLAQDKVRNILAKCNSMKSS